MKKCIALLLLAVLFAGLTGCGGKDTAFDGAALAQELLGSPVFSVSLDELPSSKASVFYNVDGSKVVSATMYHGSGISKEQFAIFEASDEEAARAMVPVLQNLVDEWIEADRDYAPAEVPKLESAVLRQSGKNVILVVANDGDAAADIVGKYL
ncbi:MAG: DUF4358 domain-containing protein [Ruminococcaceae bacterium]|nr:DUF4358 domain-containing protein [Oscillospiraceae bacterium]